MRRLACSLLLIVAIGACATVEANTSTCFETGCLHGSCQMVGNSAQCVCYPRWTGPTCDACTAGYLDRDGDGICTPACTPGFCTGAHEECVESPTPTCLCAPGYARPSFGGDCAKTYGPLDPDIETTAWSVRGDAQLISGPLSGVYGVYGSGFVRMYGDGEVFQTFTMPPHSETGPLAVSVALRCPRGCANVLPRASLTLDGHPFDISFFAGASTSICLGERAFGRNVTLGLRTYANELGVSGDDAYVDRIEFVPSPGCAAPGTVVNGDFESDGYTPGRIDRGGNHKAVLASRCRSIDATSPLFTTTSIGIGQNALAFAVESKQKQLVVATLDAVTIGAATVTPEQSRAVICLPRWSRGWAPTLQLDARLPYQCSGGDAGSVVIDDLVLTSDPSCGDEPLRDGGFELDPSAWAFDGGYIARDTWPHTGSAHAELVSTTCGSASTVSTSFTLPERTAGAGGPAVKLWTRSSSPAPVAYVRIDTLTTQSPSLTISGGWAPSTVCLDPRSWGHAGAFAATLVTTDCTQPANVAIDDVSVGPDPACPE